MDNLVEIRQQNKKRLKEVIRITFGLGINVTEKTSLKRLVNIVCIILLISSGISILGHVYYIHKHRTDFYSSSESFCTALQTLISFIKLIHMLRYEYRFRKIYKTIIDCEIIRETEIFKKDFMQPFKGEIEDAFKKCWRSALNQIIFYICACTSIISFYFFNSLISYTYYRVAGIQNYSYPHVFITEYPLYERSNGSLYYYVFATFVDGCADYIAGMGAVSYDGAFVVMSLHGVALLKILKKMIVYSTSEHIAPEYRVQYLHDCTAFYQKCMGYCNDVGTLYSKVTLVQFLESMMVLGVVLYICTYGLERDRKQFFKMILYMSAGGYELVIYCTDGQKLADESESIPFSWYDTKWYDETPQFKKIVYMNIQRTSKILYLDAWQFTTMSLPTLQSILKTSGSYFLMLKNLTS